MDRLKAGDIVKINPSVYDDKWEGWEELYKKYGHHNLEVDRVIDMSDVGKGITVVVGYPYHYCNKSEVKNIYLMKC